MIYEYFSFYNEYDMLELKLLEHSPHVDRFVITESNRTYNQIEKPYRLEQHWDRYKDWHDKITYLKFDADSLDAGWATEVAQREFGFRTVKPEHSDIILVSDLDELMTEREFGFVRDNVDNGQREILLRMSCYWCFADVLHEKRHDTVAALRYHNFVNANTHRRPQKVFQHLDDPMRDTLSYDGGFHFTWMGDRKQFEQKMLGSIEGYQWTKGKDPDKMWDLKKKNRLFNWKVKWKKGKTQHVPLDQNNEFTKTMKDYIKNKPAWLLHG